MTKHWRWGLGIGLLLVAGYWLIPADKPVVGSYAPVEILSLPKTVAKLKPRVAIDSHKKPLNRLPASVTYANKPSPDWEQKLEANLKHQAPNLKEINIEKENSLVWMRDNNALLVESVKISLKNQHNSYSSFRALVDSQTGKVLETWDRTINDPLDRSTQFGIKIDPRYSY